MPNRPEPTDPTEVASLIGAPEPRPTTTDPDWRYDDDWFDVPNGDLPNPKNPRR